MPSKARRFARTTKEFCQRHPKIPGYLWLAGTGGFTALGGYSGAFNQMAAGVLDYISQGVASTRGGQKYGYPIASLVNTLSVTTWQFPHLMTGSPSAWVGYSLAVISNIPVIAEPWVQERATRSLENFRKTGTTLTAKSAEIIKKATLEIFSNPRPFWSATHTACMLPLAFNDLMHKHYLMMPIYFLWVAGNVTAGLTRPLPAIDGKSTVLNPKTP